MYVVFEAVADGVNYYRGILTGEPEAIARVQTRAGIDAGKRSQFRYVDRTGKLRLPFGDAVELARAFCGAEPSTILPNVEVPSGNGPNRLEDRATNTRSVCSMSTARPGRSFANGPAMTLL